jgi:hypothetical protein
MGLTSWNLKLPLHPVLIERREFERKKVKIILDNKMKSITFATPSKFERENVL